jgi:molybdate transport system substrate-binding protein
VIVLSSLALKGVLEELRPAAELRFDSTQAILKRTAQGERADLLILTTEAMEELRKAGRVTQVGALGSSGVGVAVRAGAPKPDISTPEALLRALLRAASVAHSRSGASGIYFSQVLETLRIADRLKKRVIVDKGPVGLAVARGEAELGVQMLCELAPVAGIDIVGPLPGRLQVQTHFAAGIPVESSDAKGALALVALLRTDAARRVMREGGLEPAA